MFSFLAKDNEFPEPIHLSDQQENILEKNIAIKAHLQSLLSKKVRNKTKISL